MWSSYNVFEALIRKVRCFLLSHCTMHHGTSYVSECVTTLAHFSLLHLILSPPKSPSESSKLSCAFLSSCIIFIILTFKRVVWSWYEHAEWVSAQFCFSFYYTSKTSVREMVSRKTQHFANLASFEDFPRHQFDWQSNINDINREIFSINITVVRISSFYWL